MTQVAAELGRLVRTRHVTVAALAEAAGIDESTIYKWLSGQTRPSFLSIALIARHSGSPAVQSAMVRCLVGERSLVTIPLDERPPKGQLCQRAIAQMVSASSSIQTLSLAPNPRAYAQLHRHAVHDVELALRALGHAHQFLHEQAPTADDATARPNAPRKMATRKRRD